MRFKKAKPASTPTKGGKGPKTRRLADFAGHGAALLIVTIFVTIFAFSSFQLDGWRRYIYRDTLNLGDSCRLTTLRSTAPVSLAQMRGQPSVSLEVPHKSLEKITHGSGNILNLYYHCAVPVTSIPQTDDLTYLHLGWVGGEAVSVYINGTERNAFRGPDKPSLVIDKSDYSTQDLFLLEILVNGTKIKETGMVGLAPLVISHGTAINFRVLGLETLLQNVRPLYQILPLLTLGIILVFGWFFGLRSRLLAITLIFFVMAAMENVLNLFGDFSPLPMLQTFNLRAAFKTGTNLTFLIFGLEILGFHKRWILKAQVVLFTVVLSELLIIAFGSDLRPNWITLSRAYVAVVGCLYLMGRGSFQLARVKPTSLPEKGRLVVNWIFIALAGVALAINAAEIARLRFNIDMRIVDHYMNLLMPLFIGGIVIYTLYLTEQNLVIEKEARSRLETELTLASKLQGIMVPKELTGTFGDWSYEIESKAYGHLGGDWAKTFNGKRGSLLALGDVVGKGPAAALTHSGIAAVWESQIKLWDKGQISTEDLIAEINSTMYDLYQGSMNTTFAICEVIKGERARVAAGGNFWLHLTAERGRPITSVGRILIGVKPDFSVQFEALDIKPGDWLVTFTDGVLEGNRPVKHFVKRVQEEFAGADTKKIRQLLEDAGRETVHPDDASSLIMHNIKKPDAAAA